MRQASIFIALGLLAGLALASWIGRDPLPLLGGASEARDAGQTPRSAAERELAARVAELERRLGVETERRVALESTVTALGERLGSEARPPPVDDASAAVDLGAVDRPDRAEFFAERRALLEQQASPDYRRDQLVEAGFAPDQAQWILDREAQLRMDLLNAQYAARRDGEDFNPFEQQRSAQMEMREQLGDAAYEQYLEATGQPTSAPVFEVLQNSPGYEAGLRSGDEIVGYDGNRVFSIMDLNALTLEGNPGETVAVDILRDGQPLQLYMPRGPVGIAGGGFGMRRAAGAMFVR